MLFLIMLVIALVLTVLFSLVDPKAGFGGFILGAWLMAVVGWIANIVTIFGLPPFSFWGAAEGLRVIGIFVAPIGSILGYL